MEKRAMTIIFRVCAVAIGFIFITIPGNAQVLLNGGFETPGGPYTNSVPPNLVTTAAVNWVQFANGLRTDTNETGAGNVARSGEFALKCFGSSSWDGEGAYQVISNGVSPGATYVLTGYGYIPSSDPLTNTSPTAPSQPFGLVQLNFTNETTHVGSSVSAPSLFSQNGTDVWLSAVVTGVAPPGVDKIKVYVMELACCGASFNTGAIFFDDITLVNINAPIVTNFYTLAISRGNQVCWPTQTNAAYQAQSSPNNVTWTDVGTPLPGDGNTNCTFESGAFGQRFYRVLELQ